MVGKFAGCDDDYYYDDDDDVHSEWERQFTVKETELSRMSDNVLQLHDVMNQLVIAIRDEANRLRTCGTA